MDCLPLPPITLAMGAPFRIDARIATARPHRAAEARRAPRISVMVATTLRALGLHGRHAIVRDLSANGFMAETDQEFLPGETARVQLPEIGFVSARVIWAREGKVGGEFDRAITPGPLARLIALGTTAAEV